MARDEGLGWRFWLWVVAVAFGVGIAGFLLFVLMGWAWYAWGFFGMFIFFGAIAVLLAYIHDRREANRRKEYAA